jgi:hypothetical protein
MISYTNWKDHPLQPVLSLEDYNIETNSTLVVSSFWDSKISYSENGKLGIGILPPHATWLVVVRNLIPERPMLVGSNLHISQGMEVSKWKDSGKQIQINLKLPRICSGEILLRIPCKEIEILDTKRESETLTGKNQLFVIPVQFDREEQIIINYK